MTKKPLYKTRVILWTEWDPNTSELSHLAREAETGDGYCSFMQSTVIPDPEADPDWDGTEYFEERATEPEGET